MKARALSIRQPWAWLIVRPDLSGVERFQAIQRGIMKLVENRSWPTRFRGGFLVHAAKGMTSLELASAIAFATDVVIDKSFPDARYPDTGRFPLLPAEGKPGFDQQLDRGGFIGYAEVTDCMCTERHESMPAAKRSPWFMGEYGFALANVHPLAFLPYIGSLGFFTVDVPDDYIPAHLRERLAP